MKTKVFSIIGIGLIVAGAIFGCFSGLDVVTVALAFLGATMEVIAVVKETKESGKTIDWKFWVALSCTVVGAILCGIGGVVDNVVTTIIGAVITVVTIIIAMIKK